MKLIIPIFTILIFLFNCEAKSDKVKYGMKSEDKDTILKGLLLYSQFKDNGDGTILDNSTGLVWKKCSQGQSYSSTANNCLANVGSNSTIYVPVDLYRAGAQVFNFCNVLGNDCNSLGFPQDLVANPKSNSVSESYQTCASDRTGGYSNWRVPNLLELKKLASGSRNALLTNFPSTLDDLYWSSWGNVSDYTGNTAKAVSFAIPTFGNEVSLNKTSRNFIRCVRSR